MAVPDVARRFREGIAVACKRLWDRVLHTQRLGRIAVRFYHPTGPISISTSFSLDALSRQEWHWLYLQHLAESLRSISRGEAGRLLEAARALAEELTSGAYWSQMIGQKIGASRGGVELVPERPGGTAFTIEVVRLRRGMPSVRLKRLPPLGRVHVVSANLALLVHVMRGAAHPLEQYELFKKIAVFAEYCERAGRWHNRATLHAAPLYAVVHTDLADVRTVAAGTDTKGHGAADVGAGRKDRPAQPRACRTAPVRPPWRRGAFVLATAVVCGVIAGTLVMPRGGGMAPPRPQVAHPRAQERGAAVVRGHSRLAAIAPRRGGVPLPARQTSGSRENVSSRETWGRSGTLRRAPNPMGAVRLLPPLPGAGAPDGGNGALSEHRRAQPPELELRAGSDSPRFRVVSGVLARDVAELQARALAERGIDSVVRMTDGHLARVQYGAYRSREIAEADARRIRAQGYTATVIGWEPAPSGP